MTFLEEWDAAIAEAKETGRPGLVWRSWFGADGEYNLRPVARTMHPAFMAGVSPKYDPERDK
jgi:hypothetical protein